MADKPTENPPKIWLEKRERAAKSYEDLGETVAAKAYREATHEIARKYAARDAEAIKTVNKEIKELP